MSQYCQMKTSHGFQGCAKIVLWLHTARTENPDTPQKHPSASDIHEYRSDTSKNPPDIPQTPPRPLQGAWDANRKQQTTTDTTRQPQTPQDTDRCCFSMSGGVCWGLLSSVGISWSLDRSGGCLGDVWWVSGCFWAVFMEIRGNRMCLRGIWVLKPCSIEPQHYFGTALKGMTCFHLTILRHQNIKMSIPKLKPKLNKNSWFCRFFVF